MIWLFPLIFLLFSCAVKEGREQVRWQYYYDLGMSSYVAKNYSEAIANFFRASQLAPNEPKVWNALGLAYMEVQEYQKSESAFLRALQTNKAYTEAKLNLGILYYREEKYERAEKVLVEVLEDEAFPQKHMAFYYLGKVYQAMGNFREYIINLRKATAYNPMFVDAQLELAQAYESQGDYNLAKSVYLNLISNGIVNPNLELSMARVEYLLGNYTPAKNYIKKVLEDRQASPQVKTQAYDILTQVLIAEQARITPPKVEIERPPQVEMERPTQVETEKLPQAETEKPSQTEVEEAQQTEKPQETADKEPSKEPSSPPREVSQPKSKIYRIQVGAFSSVNFARAWKNKLEKDYNLKELAVVEASGIFKVLYGIFNSREEAQKELRRLKGMNIYGFIVNE